MLESEHAISATARHGPVVPRRVCEQLLSVPTRYALWHVRHEQRMGAVADARVRQRQVLALREFALAQIHGSALVRYLRDGNIVGEARDRTLRDFFGVADSRDATLMAHRAYLLAASSHVCAMELLDLANDRHGVELLVDYEQTYGQFFSMFCDTSRARLYGEPSMVTSLLPEVRAAAVKLRRGILEGESRGVRRSNVERLPAVGALSIQSHTLVVHPPGFK
jgi:hypothetical protein